MMSSRLMLSACAGRRTQPPGKSSRWDNNALIVDAGALYGVADGNDPDHAAVVETNEQWPGELVVSAFTAAEPDRLVLTRLGLQAELALIEDLAITYTVQVLDSAGLRRAGELYAALELGWLTPRWWSWPSNGER